MTITEAMRLASDEYNAEVDKAHQDPTFDQLMKNILENEYKEIDGELPDYVGEILSVARLPPGILDPRIYSMARMVFRMGMRTQRKLDHPEQETSLFWRSDQVQI